MDRRINSLKLDIPQLQFQAAKKKISIYYLVKEKLKYSEFTEKSNAYGNVCKYCRNKVEVNFKNKVRIQCRLIDVWDDRSADVELNHTCRRIKR